MGPQELFEVLAVEDDASTDPMVRQPALADQGAHHVDRDAKHRRGLGDRAPSSVDGLPWHPVAPAARPLHADLWVALGHGFGYTYIAS
jgi:hypothetical protein